MALQRKLRWFGGKPIEAELALSPLEAEQSVCLKREDLGAFLEKALLLTGVKPNETEAFVAYWTQVFEREYAAPYLLVQMVNHSQLEDYIPKMEVTGERAEEFTLARRYFRFEPAAREIQAVDPNAYLANLQLEQELGSHAVIDLGGEVEPSRDGVNRQGGLDSDAFNAQFIDQYIRI